MLNKEYDYQTQLASTVYEMNTDKINENIVSTADAFLAYNVPLDHEYAYRLMFNDGLYGPWFDCSGSDADCYSNYVADHGNTEAEAMYLTTVWCYVLTNKTDDPVKYLPIVAKFLDIQVNGL